MGRAGGSCVVYFMLVLFFLTAAATKGRGNVAVSSREAHSGRVVLVAFVNVLLSPLVSASLFLLSLLPFLLLLLFASPSLLPLP
jgi:hypothetical protein